MFSTPRFSWPTVFASGILGLIVAATTGQQPPEPNPGIFDQLEIAGAEAAPEEPAGVETQASGPVHEAFAEPGSQTLGEPMIAPSPPPEAIEELPPAEKPAGDDVQWIGGYWSWHDERADFIWVSGIWRAPPPRRTWVVGYWTPVASRRFQWTNGFWNLEDNGDVVVLPELPADFATRVDDEPGPRPYEHAVYSPGCYVYQEDRYTWREGCWIEQRPGWVWVPAHYIHTPCGCVFVEGYWDRVLEDRGCLFAPVYVNYRNLAPDYCYTPRYVVHSDCLLSSLWVRPGCNNYYFGDCYSSVWNRCGLLPCLDVRYRDHCHDPLFGYYRWQRSHDHWDDHVRSLHRSRLEDASLRPPRTLSAQNQFVNVLRGVTDNRSSLAKAGVMLGAVSLLNQKVVKTEKLDATRLSSFQTTAKQHRKASHDHAQMTRDLLSTHAQTGGKVVNPNVLLHEAAKPKNTSVVVGPKTPGPQIDPRKAIPPTVPAAITQKRLQINPDKVAKVKVSNGVVEKTPAKDGLKLPVTPNIPVTNTPKPSTTKPSTIPGVTPPVSGNTPVTNTPKPSTTKPGTIPGVTPPVSGNTPVTNTPKPSTTKPSTIPGVKPPAPGNTPVTNTPKPSTTKPSTIPGVTPPAPGNTPVTNTPKPSTTKPSTIPGVTPPVPGNTPVTNTPKPSTTKPSTIPGVTAPAPGNTPVTNTPKPSTTKPSTIPGVTTPAPGNTPVTNTPKPSTTKPSTLPGTTHVPGNTPASNVPKPATTKPSINPAPGNTPFTPSTPKPTATTPTPRSNPPASQPSVTTPKPATSNPTLRSNPSPSSNPALSTPKPAANNPPPRGNPAPSNNPGNKPNEQPGRRR